MYLWQESIKTHNIIYTLCKLIQLTRALELPSQFVGSLVTVGRAVAQPGELVQLQNRSGLVHLTSEVSVFQVQKEYFPFYAESDSSLSVYLRREKIYKINVNNIQYTFINKHTTINNVHTVNIECSYFFGYSPIEREMNIIERKNI